MGLRFDGTGYISLATKWVSSLGDQYELYFDFVAPASTAGTTLGFVSESGSDRSNVYVSSADDLGTTVIVRYERQSSGVNTVSLDTGGVSLRDGNRHTIKVGITGATFSLTVDGTLASSVDVSPDTPFAFEALLVGFYEYNTGLIPLPNLTELYEVRFTDLNDTANSSVYLLDEGMGLTAGDTGTRANNGTLTDFVDPEAAWIVTAVPGLPSDILQFEGAALANLTGLQVFMTRGSVFWGTVIHDDTTATTDATGRYAAITPTSGAVGDSVLLYFLTADGKGVVVPKTLEDIS